MFFPTVSIENVNFEDIWGPVDIFEKNPEKFAAGCHSWDSIFLHLHILNMYGKFSLGLHGCANMNFLNFFHQLLENFGHFFTFWAFFGQKYF